MGHPAFLAGPASSRLLLDSFVATTRGRAAGEVYVVFVRAGRPHRAQAPVTGGGFDAGEPRCGVLRSGAVRILGTEALAGLRVMLGGAHAGFLSAARPFPASRPRVVNWQRWGRGPFVQPPAKPCGRWPPETAALCRHSW